MHHRTIVLPLPLLLFTAACSAWTPEPDEAEHGTSSSSGSSGVAPTTTGSTSWPPLPPSWGATPDLGVPEASTSFGTGTEGPVLSDTEAGKPPIDLSVLRITEVLADPAGKDGAATGPEFVEITHIGEVGLELAGLVISARGWPELWMGDLGIAFEILAPGDRLVVERYANAADLPVPAVLRAEGVLRVAFADSGGLRNADGAVSLRDQDGAIGDAVIYGAPQPEPWGDPALWMGAPAPAAANGESLCRFDITVDTDTAADWAICAATPGTLPIPDDEVTTGEPPLPAEVAIVEVLSNPVGPAPLEKHAEFVEIINLGPGTVDLAGFTIADAADPDAPGVDPLLYFGGDGGCAPVTCLAPGHKALVVGSLYEGPVGEALVLKTDDTAIANAGLGAVEPLVLRDAEGEIASTYRLWPDPLAAPDPSMQEQALVRSAPDAPDDPESWSFAEPTPGT